MLDGLTCKDNHQNANGEFIIEFLAGIFESFTQIRSPNDRNRNISLKAVRNECCQCKDALSKFGSSEKLCAMFTY